MDNTNLNEPSASKMIAGFCSFIFPGLGQLLLGRLWSAFECLIFAIVTWAISFKIVYEGLDSGSNIIVPLGALITLLPNLLAAYYATNGKKEPSIRLENEAYHQTPNTDFQNYSEYLAWCNENSQEAIPLNEFEKALGK